MRAVIVGPGAVGVWMGERLAASGATMSALGRGATLAALQAHGFRVREGGETRSQPVIASDDASALGPQDYVIISLKAQALPQVAPRLAPLIGPKTAIVSAMNGVPWWFFQGFGGPMDGAVLRSVDPQQTLCQLLPVERVIGCVLHNSNACPEPGLSEVAGIDRLMFGEPNGVATSRVTALADAFRTAAVRADIDAAIRTPIWAKLWGNMAMNPLSALTLSGTGAILGDDGVRAMVIEMMREMAAVGAAFGITLPVTPEQRIAVTRKLGDFRTSMLQDREQGRDLEIEPLLGAVVEIGARLGLPTPYLAAVLGMTRLLSRATASLGSR